MLDLYLRASNADALASACPWLRIDDEDGLPQWATSGDGFAFAVIDDDDAGVTGILRADEALAQTVPQDLIVQNETPPKQFAGLPPD